MMNGGRHVAVRSEFFLKYINKSTKERNKDECKGFKVDYLCILIGKACCSTCQTLVQNLTVRTGTGSVNSSTCAVTKKKRKNESDSDRISVVS